MLKCEKLQKNRLQYNCITKKLGDFLAYLNHRQGQDLHSPLYSRIAQQAEQLTFNQWVCGSNPHTGTKGEMTLLLSKSTLKIR